MLTAADDDSVKMMEVNVNRYAVPTSAKELAKNNKRIYRPRSLRNLPCSMSGQADAAVSSNAREVLKNGGKRGQTGAAPDCRR